MGPEQASQSGGPCAAPGVLSTLILTHSLVSTVSCSQVAALLSCMRVKPLAMKQGNIISAPDSVLDGSCIAISRMYHTIV